MRLDEAARQYLGVPWRRMGRTRYGVDCIGLLLLAAKDCGYNVPEIEPYEDEPSDSRLADTLLEYCDEVMVAQMQPCDIATFQVGLYAGHIGIVSIHPEFLVPSLIHAYAPRRKVIEEPIENLSFPVWRVFRPRA